jgi:rubrerythrin
MKKDKILDLFEQNELNVSRLYKLYSKIDEKYQKFWEKLAQEEIQHALEIRESYQGQEDIFQENKFSRGIIKYVADFVQESVDRAKKDKLSQTEALETALRIEQSFLEKKCFEIFIPSHQKVKKVLEKLNQETEEHVERLRNKLEKLTKNK